MRVLSFKREWILTIRKLCVFFTLALILVLGFTAKSTALSLTPDPAIGNPKTAGPANGLYVTLIPNPAQLMSYCPWLIPAAQAAAQPYNNATNVWNFSYADSFNGTFNMTQYAATISGSGGGANFSLTYTAGQGDPSGTDVRWMQVIDTNLPTARGTTYGVAGTSTNGIPVGTTAYLDNAGPGSTGVPIDPYYGWLSATDSTDITTSTAANSTHFTDTPFLSLVNGRDWEAQAFVAKETTSIANGITTHNVKIYGGVWWGFRMVPVPEPTTLTLFVIGVVFLVGLGYKRRLQKMKIGFS